MRTVFFSSLSSFLLILSLIPGGAFAEGESHPFTVRDLLAMERISDPQLAPDEKSLVFVLRSTDLEADRGRTDLWSVGVDGAGLRRLTTDPAGDFNPRWAADGKAIYFLSTRSGSSQIWRLPMNGGEAEPVTAHPVDVSNLVVSPDGKRVAFSAEVFPDCEDLACTADRLTAEGEKKTTGRVYDGLFFRHWDTWKDGRRSHMWVQEVEGEAPPRDLTAGLDADVPSKPFGGAEEITFTPDGQGLVYTARVAGREEPWSTNFDLFHVPVDGSAPARNLTADNLAWDTGPVFSPDGGSLVYFAMERPGYESDRFRIVVQPWPATAGTVKKVLTEDWDRSPRAVAFSPDGRRLYATAGDLGQVSLFEVGLPSGKVERRVSEGNVRSPLVAGDRLIFGRASFTSPVELYSSALDGSGISAITSINRERLTSVRMGEAEQFTFPGWNGESVHAYVVKPVDFDPAAKVPVAFLVHGGPQGSFGNNFHYRWNPQTYSGAGYAAVMVDFHGSTGYGQAFTDSIRDDWGGKPLEDLRKGLAAALERYPWLDGDRVCALGASYGGFMMNWIAGSWPEGFRCLVNHDGLFDNRMMYYTTEELWFPEWDHRGPYFSNKHGHEKHNPVDLVENWKTPMLVVHGALDFRVPETQGFATFTALQRRGIPSRLLYFPNENHWVLKPNNSIQWHEEVLSWIDLWTSKN